MGGVAVLVQEQNTNELWICSFVVVVLTPIDAAIASEIILSFFLRGTMLLLYTTVCI
jgi:hypothetical protein